MGLDYKRKPKVKSRRDPAPGVALCGPGRPSVYDPEYPNLARRCKLLGMTDEEMATFFGVGPSIIATWKQQYPEFSCACAEGGEAADAKVVEALYKRAIGYTHKAEKIMLGPGGTVIRAEYVEHYPPDQPSINLFLGNHRRGRWSMRPEPQPVDDDDKDSTGIKITGGLPEE